MVDLSLYARNYSDRGFWTKLAGFALKAGKQLVHVALILYYALSSPETPAWAKAVIVGALGYFISPIDLIPDAIPVLGYTDDLAVVMGALKAVSAYVTPEHSKRADKTIKRWFGAGQS